MVSTTPSTSFEPPVLSGAGLSSPHQDPDSDRAADGMDADLPTRSGRTRWQLVVLGLTIVLGAGAGGAVLARSADDRVAPAGAAPVAETADGEISDGAATATSVATVEIRDLIETQRLSGTLGYDDALSVINRANGTVTSVTRAGMSIGRGDELYRIDGQPVIALFGESGAWRALGPGATAGADVRQLEENLAALGHDPDNRLTIDDRWDGATTAAVKRWQRSLGVDDDGRVDLADVIYLPGPGQVAGVDVARGMGVGDGSPVLRYQARLDVDTVIGARKGNVTSMAPLASTLEAGSELYAVNTEATYALVGDHVVNARTLRAGVSPGA